MIYDLSHPLATGMPVWPGDMDVNFKQIKIHPETGYSVNSLLMSTHTGTHMDSPYHRVPFGEHVDSFEMLSKVVGEAIVINVSQNIRDNVVQLDGLRDALAGVIRGMRILLASGWSRFWGNGNYFKDFPSVSKELAFFLVDKGINLIGIDSPSVDRPEEDTIHDVFLPAGIPIIENLNNLHSLGEGTVFFSAAPLRLTGLDGSPVRAYAIK